MKTMTSTKALVSFVALVAFAIFTIVPVSAFGDIVSLEVNDVDFNQQPFGITAGETIDVQVTFKATSTEEEVRVKAEISGDREFAAVTREFAVLEDNTYTWHLVVKVPSTLDEDDLEEELELRVIVDSRNEGKADEEVVRLTLQRESHLVELLDVELPHEARAGDVIPVDVVLKNRGRQTAEDTFVRVTIPALQLEDRAYFGDLTSKDQDDPDKEDSAERRLFLRIPSNVPAGVYVVEIEAFNDDSVSTFTKKIAITGAEKNTLVVAPVHSKSFDAGATGEYSVVVVNSGNRLAVFELVVETSSDLNVEVSEPIVAIPAGSSKTVKLFASSDKIGTHNFAVNVHSGAELVKRESFTANVQGNDTSTVTGNPTVLLTVVLAVIFVVLLVVLIVLLTRKPERSEELGESYY